MSNPIKTLINTLMHTITRCLTMPIWFKLNEHKFMVSIDALLNPLGDLWRFIDLSEAYYNDKLQPYLKFIIDAHKRNPQKYPYIDVTLKQYRDNGYGYYGYAYVTFYGKLRKDDLIVFTRYTVDYSDIPRLKWNRDYEYETLVLWARDLIRESHRIHKIPTVTITTKYGTVTTSKTTYRKIKRELAKDKRVFYLGCHNLTCVTRYFVFLKPNDKRITTTDNNKTAIVYGCPRCPSVPHKHIIGELNEIEITKEDVKNVKLR